ncbi:hypothetical protein HDU96_007123 [Phlyctochytrium bullatum]|nr:hypothetical protein HDU96_007123 [Phlyctochytrium bullatum]
MEAQLARPKKLKAKGKKKAVKQQEIETDVSPPQTSNYLKSPSGECLDSAVANEVIEDLVSHDNITVPPLTLEMVTGSVEGEADQAAFDLCYPEVAEAAGATTELEVEIAEAMATPQPLEYPELLPVVSHVAVTKELDPVEEVEEAMKVRHFQIAEIRDSLKQLEDLDWVVIDDEDLDEERLTPNVTILEEDDYLSLMDQLNTLPIYVSYLQESASGEVHNLLPEKDLDTNTPKIDSSGEVTHAG